MSEHKDVPETSPEDVAENTLPVPADHSWAVTGANWFLIAIAAALRDNWLMHGNMGAFLGSVTAVLIMSAIPACIVYLAVSKKKSYRWRRALTISAWCVLAVMFYPVIRQVSASIG